MKLYYIKASQYVKIPQDWPLIYTITRKDTSTLDLCFLAQKEYFKAQYKGYFKAIFLFSNKLCQPKHIEARFIHIFQLP
jgi:hypothetical protein